MSDLNDEGTAESSMPSTIADHLSDRGVASQLQALVAAASAQRSLTSHVVQGDYVAISPGAGGHIVGYFHPQMLSLAMPPRRAEQVGAEQGWSVELDSGITSYVRIPATTLTSGPQQAIVLALFLQSVDWRAAGPHQPTGGAVGRVAPVQPVQTCPVHFTEMLGARCDQCD